MGKIAPLHDDEVVCARCGLVTAPSELDRDMWCEECREKVGFRSRLWGYATGIVAAGGLGVWILFAVTPSDRFLLAWGLILLAAFWLVSKIAREVAVGIYRWRNRPGRVP